MLSSARDHPFVVATSPFPSVVYVTITSKHSAPSSHFTDERWVAYRNGGTLQKRLNLCPRVGMAVGLWVWAVIAHSDAQTRDPDKPQREKVATVWLERSCLAMRLHSELFNPGTYTIGGVFYDIRLYRPEHDIGLV